jgi:hypothetical protein
MTLIPPVSWQGLSGMASPVPHDDIVQGRQACSVGLQAKIQAFAVVGGDEWLLLCSDDRPTSGPN